MVTFIMSQCGQNFICFKDLTNKKNYSKLFTKIQSYIEIGRIGGGEEFGVIFYNMNLETATGIMDRIRVDIENSKIKSKKGQPLNVTISGGVTQYQPGETIDELKERTDRYMYNAKAQGKNRIVNDSNYDGSLKYIVRN